MRVAIVSTSYPDAPEDAAGHFVRADARAWASRGASVRVFAPGAPRERRPEPHGGGSIEVVRLGGEALFGWPGAAARASERPLRLLAAPPFAARAARALAREGPFDRAVAHWLVPCAFPLLEGVRAPIEAFAHGADVRLLLAAPGLVRRAIVGRLLARDAALRFVAGSLLEELCAALPGPLAARLHARATVEPAPIDLPPRAALADPRDALGLPPGARFVAWAGRLVPGKRPALAIDAARAARVRIVLVGSGPEEARLRAATRGAEVHWAGQLPRDRALAVLAAADVVLSTSGAEGAPTVVREARALGVPVVACPAGDLARWAAEDGGILLAAPDPGALAAAIRAARAREPRTGPPESAP